MYLSNRKKSNKWKVFLFFFVIIIISNFIYLEYNINTYKKITNDYISLVSEYEKIINEDIEDMKKLSIIINAKVIKIQEYEGIFEKEKIARLKVHITTYNPVIEQTDDTPDITAFGKKVKPGVIFAASNDLIASLNLKPGMKMYIPGIPSKAKDGMWEFGDKMHPRWKNRVDLMVKGKMMLSKKCIVYIFI